MPVTPAPEKLRKEDCEFKAVMCCIVRPYPKEIKSKK